MFYECQKVDVMANNITKELALTANYMSVIGGGISMPKAILEKTDSYYELKLRVPGVNPDSFSIDIVNNSLLIFHKVEENMKRQLPYLVQQIVLPSDVDFEQIRALQEGNDLVVRMPFNELSNGYHRHIDIEPPD